MKESALPVNSTDPFLQKKYSTGNSDIAQSIAIYVLMKTYNQGSPLFFPQYWLYPILLLIIIASSHSILTMKKHCFDWIKLTYQQYIEDGE